MTGNNISTTGSFFPPLTKTADIMHVFLIYSPVDEKSKSNS